MDKKSNNKYAMDPKEFEQIIDKLATWDTAEEIYVLKPKTKTCEYCSIPVTNQVINCCAYFDKRMGDYFKHQCTNCKQFVFDGSKKRARSTSSSQNQ
jgi:hypothetical protein